MIEAEAQVGPVACRLCRFMRKPLCYNSQEKREFYCSLLLCRRFQIYVHSKMMVVDDEVSPPDTMLCLWGPKGGGQQLFLLCSCGKTAVLLICGHAGSMLQLIHNLNDSSQQVAYRP